jgi:hypothetical protein
MSRKAILEAIGNEAEPKETPSTKTPVIYDKIGQPINIGDTIVYGHALGRCAALQLGRVLDIRVTFKPSQKYVGWEDDGTGKKVAKYEPYQKPEFRITVRGVEIRQCDGEAGVEGYKHDDEIEVLRKGTLQFPDRMIVIDPAKVPQNVLDALDNAPK